MPSHRIAREAMQKMIEPLAVSTIYELGCGFGGAALHLAKAFPDRQIIALENSPLPWLVSYLRCYRLKNTKILFGNFWNMDFSPVSLAVCYQYRLGVQRIYKKLNRGSHLISYCFAVDNVNPVAVLYVGRVVVSPVYHFIKIHDAGK
jgi:hypothetical protein